RNRRGRTQRRRSQRSRNQQQSPDNHTIAPLRPRSPADRPRLIAAPDNQSQRQDQVAGSRKAAAKNPRPPPRPCSFAVRLKKQLSPSLSGRTKSVAGWRL